MLIVSEPFYKLRAFYEKRKFVTVVASIRYRTKHWVTHRLHNVMFCFESDQIKRWVTDPDKIKCWVIHRLHNVMFCFESHQIKYWVTESDQTKRWITDPDQIKRWVAHRLRYLMFCFELDGISSTASHLL
jgi:hypothetical protein